MQTKIFILITFLLLLSGCALWHRLDDLPEDREGSTILYQGSGDAIKLKQGKGVYYQKPLGS